MEGVDLCAGIPLCDVGDESVDIDDHSVVIYDRHRGAIGRIAGSTRRAAQREVDGLVVLVDEVAVDGDRHELHILIGGEDNQLTNGCRVVVGCSGEIRRSAAGDGQHGVSLSRPGRAHEGDVAGLHSVGLVFLKLRPGKAHIVRPADHATGIVIYDTDSDVVLCDRSAVSREQVHIKLLLRGLHFIVAVHRDTDGLRLCQRPVRSEDERRVAAGCIGGIRAGGGIYIVSKARFKLRRGGAVSRIPADGDRLLRRPCDRHVEKHFLRDGITFKNCRALATEIAVRYLRRDGHGRRGIRINDDAVAAVIGNRRVGRVAQLHIESLIILINAVTADGDGDDFLKLSGPEGQRGGAGSEVIQQGACRGGVIGQCAVNEIGIRGLILHGHEARVVQIGQPHSEVSGGRSPGRSRLRHGHVGDGNGGGLVVVDDCLLDRVGARPAIQLGRIQRGED